MLDMNDTIAAMSTAAVSAGTVGRSIIRISGLDAFDLLSQIATTSQPVQKNKISPCVVHIDDQLDVQGSLYVFQQPHSYTRQDLVELHLVLWLVWWEVE